MGIAPESSSATNLQRTIHDLVALSGDRPWRRCSAREILAALPDIPRWVETRGMLLSGRCDILACGDSAQDVLARARGNPLVSVAGRPSLDPLEEVAGDPDARTVLCDPGLAKEVGLRLPGWKRACAVIHRLAADAPAPTRPPERMEIGILPGPDAAKLTRLPRALRAEIEDALAGGHVTVAFVDGNPVSFCYPSYETETWWDVSIDTLAAYRRRGLATACVEFAIDHMHRHGKEPVWGTLEDNEASLALAASLGFKPADQMTVFLRP